jgi:hypothetical protein
MSWSVWLLRDGAEEITGQVRVGSISAGTTASPSGLGMEFETLGGLIEGATIGSQVQIRDGATIIFRGIINAVERGDAGPIAGQYAATTYICSDIYGLLRGAIIATPEPNSAAEEAQEQPPGFRARVRAEDPDPAADLNLSPAGMFAWALGLIEDLESAKVSKRLPTISLSTALVSATPAFTFTKYFPMVAESSYWDLLNDIATMAGQGWAIDPSEDPEDEADFVLRTWNAIDRDAGNTADFEFSDDPNIAAVGEGPVLLARSISLAEDATDVINKIEVSWEKASKTIPGLIIDKRVTVSDASSIALYGERFERLATQFRTAAMAQAAGLRKLASSKNANIRGSARLPWDVSVRAGRWVLIHRADHPGDHDGHYDTYAWISTVRPGFEPGYVNPATGQEEPTWMDIDFNTDPYEASAFRPFVPVTAGPGGGADDSTTPATPPPPSPIGTNGNYVLVNVDKSVGPRTNDHPIPGSVSMPRSYTDFFQLDNEPRYTPKSAIWTLLGNQASTSHARLKPRSVVSADFSGFFAGDQIAGESGVQLFRVLTGIPVSAKVVSAKMCLVINAPIEYSLFESMKNVATSIQVAQLSYVPYGPTATPLTAQEMAVRLTGGGTGGVPATIGGSIVGGVQTFAVKPGINRFVFDFQPGLYPSDAESAYPSTKMAAYFVMTVGSSSANTLLLPVLDSTFGVPAARAAIVPGATGVPSGQTTYFVVDRAVPTEAFEYGDPTERREIGFDISEEWSASFGSYALIQVSGTTASANVQSTTNEFAGTSRQNVGRTSFTLSAPGKREGMVVKLYTTATAYGETVTRAKDITAYVSVDLNDDEKVVAIDIARAASYGLLANQKLTVEFGD